MFPRLTTASHGIITPSGNTQIVRAILDSASQSTLITEHCAQMLGVKRNCLKSSNVQGILSTKVKLKGGTHLNISTCGGIPLAHAHSVLIIDKITSNMPQTCISPDVMKKLKHFVLADPTFNESGFVQMLIGADLFAQTLTGDLYPLGKDMPIALGTIFGFVVMASAPSISEDNNHLASFNLITLFSTTDIDLHNSLQQFWKLEEPPLSKVVTRDEEICESTKINRIPEIPDDIPENPLSRIEGLPEISSLTTEKCVAAIGKHTLDYESGVRQIEKKIKDSGSPPRLFPDVLDPLEILGAHLDTTWGLVKTLYLTNSKLMPTNCYMGIHDRARRARATKFNSLPIYTACKESTVSKDGTYSDEQNRVVSKFLLEGRLNGLELKGDEKINFKEILAKIANERKQFQEKIELSTKKFRHVIRDPNMVRDFPEDLLKSMATDSTQPSRGPWTVTLQPHIYSQFLEFCGDRDLRKCQAQLLGFESFADMSMETKMAGSVQEVHSMINSLLKRGHVMIMKQNRMHKIAPQNKEMGRRPIGRPRTRCMEQPQKDIEAKGVNWRCVAEGEVWKKINRNGRECAK
uniref:Peptidase A2 domain-containing protein n=1 Tax=Timema douglasi TaxID=61478 RepID=A0A7R8V9A3_TIMDO|nr:unnamed protein product [Timema douglasi]